MARPPFLHQEELDAFKHEIGYERLLEKLPPDKRVLLDWEQTVKEFKDTEGTMWRGKTTSVFGMASMASLSVSLKSDTGIVSMNVYSLPGGQKEAIEEALHSVAMTSMRQIHRKLYEPCFADFCLAPKSLLGSMDRFDFVYGNLYVKLDCIEHLGRWAGGGNVLPIARALHAAMERAVAANPEGRLPARPKITYAVNPTHIKVGESFTVTATFGTGSQMDPKTFDVANELLSTNVEYEEDLGKGVFKFTAKTPGPSTVAFGLLDKKSLWVFTDTVPVTIEPVQ